MMAKPKFNPNEEFEVVKEPQGTKPKFNPEESFEEVNSQEKPSKFSKLDSYLRGGAQGLSFGLADEGSGAVGALGSLFSDESFADSYRRNRDESRDVYQEAEKANPKSYTGGLISGGVGASLVPIVGQVGKLGQGASLGARILAGLKAGATVGGLAGAGNSKADLTKGEVGQFVKDTGKSAAVGSVFGGALPVGGTVLSSVPKVLKSGARGLLKRGIKPTPNVAKEITNEGLDLALDSMGTLTSTARGVYSTSKKAASDAYSVIDDLVSNSKNKISTNEYVSKIVEKAKELRASGRMSEAKILEGQAQKVKNNFGGLDMEDLSPDVLNNLKKDLYNSVNYRSGTTATIEGKKNAAKMAKESVEDVVSQGDDYIKSIIQKYNRQYGQLAPIKEAAKKSAETVNPLGGLLDVTAGTAGAAAGLGPLGAVATAAARRSMPSAQIAGANILNKLSRGTGFVTKNAGKYASVLEQAALRGGNAVAATNYILQQTDPEYRMQTKDYFGDK